MAVSPGIDLIADERKRQIESEGWTSTHDDSHDASELSRAAVCYTEFAIGQLVYDANTEPYRWPWEKEFWKPSLNPIRNLVKAGALIAAEIDRIQREQEKKQNIS